MNEEVIETLKIAETCCLCTDDRLRPIKHIQKALAKLREVPEPTDEMTKKFNESIEKITSIFTIAQAMAKNSFDSTLLLIKDETDNPDPPPDHEYPDCKLPEPTDFTKDFREQIGRQAVGIGSISEIQQMAKEACDIIDQQAAEIDKLIAGQQAKKESGS